MGNLNGGEITILVFLILDLCGTAFLHGSKRDDKYNFWAKLIGVTISFIIYKWAGLF